MSYFKLSHKKAKKVASSVKRSALDEHFEKFLRHRSMKRLSLSDVRSFLSKEEQNMLDKLNLYHNN